MGVTPEDRMFVRNFINDNCIARVPHGSKELPSYLNQGTGYYLWQFYLREAFFNPRILNIIVQDFMSKYETPIKKGIIQLCGVESASTPLLTGIVLECAKRGYEVNVFSIRQNQKPYGRKNWLEGRVLRDRLAMMVDDVISDMHKTAIHGSSILAEQKVPIANQVYAVLYKTNKPQNNVIKLLGHDATVNFMFSLNNFDLHLKTYNMNRRIYPWEVY